MPSYWMDERLPMTQNTPASLLRSTPRIPEVLP